jgi:protein-S-isoprenylcysteine O-methyltransferase Ste14
VSRRRRNRLYAAVQTGLFLAFSTAFFARSPLLFLSEKVRDVGTAVCALGVLLMLLGFVSLRPVIQIAPEPHPDGDLVRSGIYRWLRHPMYTGILALIVGLFLRRPTIVVAIAGAFVTAFLLLKTRFEEALLNARYAEYSEYRKKTVGILPGL